jgi:hypothetical protein
MIDIVEVRRSAWTGVKRSGQGARARYAVICLSLNSILIIDNCIDNGIDLVSDYIHGPRGP